MRWAGRHGSGEGKQRRNPRRGWCPGWGLGDLLHVGEGRTGHRWVWVSGFAHYVMRLEPRTRYGAQRVLCPWAEQSRAGDRG